jgi:hypothetical protein
LEAIQRETELQTKRERCRHGLTKVGHTPKNARSTSVRHRERESVADPCTTKKIVLVRQKTSVGTICLHHKTKQTPRVDQGGAYSQKRSNNESEIERESRRNMDSSSQRHRLCADTVISTNGNFQQEERSGCRNHRHSETMVPRLSKDKKPQCQNPVKCDPET